MLRMEGGMLVMNPFTLPLIKPYHTTYSLEDLNLFLH